LVNTIKLRSRSPLRNCFRCGREFHSEGGDRVCVACRKPKPGSGCLSPKLSFREKQVINLIAQAKLNKEIAHELHLTEGTIKEYLNRIFRKLGVTNRTELAVWALTQKSTPAKGGVGSLAHSLSSPESVGPHPSAPSRNSTGPGNRHENIFEPGDSPMERRPGGRPVRIQ
jgi:DNA-binding CsgD family transcriptional regulator